MSAPLARVPTDLAQQWATRVNRHLGEAVEAILATGRELAAAKKALKHGGWERIFAGHAEAVKEPVPFTVRTAQRFIVIAEHAVLSKTTHGSLLPASWRTLYELSQLPEHTLTAALNDGRIHPAMERRDVAKILHPSAGHEAEPWRPELANGRLHRSVEAELKAGGDAETLARTCFAQLPPWIESQWLNREMQEQADRPVQVEIS